MTERVPYLQHGLVSHALLCLIKVLQDAASPHLSPPPREACPAWPPCYEEAPPYKTQLQTLQTIYRSPISHLRRGPAAGPECSSSECRTRLVECH